MKKRVGLERLSPERSEERDQTGCWLLVWGAGGSVHQLYLYKLISLRRSLVEF